MFVLAVVGGGMAVGGLAQYALAQPGSRIGWAMALFTGVAGSLVGGILLNLLNGDGLLLRPGGLAGSYLGAFVLTAAWIRAEAGTGSD